MRLRILEWKNTTTLYIATVQALDSFVPSSLHELKRKGAEIWMVGRLKGSGREDLYALGYRKYDMDFDEARERAIATIERYNALSDAGKDPLTSLK